MTWKELKVWTPYPRSARETAFSLVKNIVSRAKCQRFFYTCGLKDDRWEIIMRFEDLKTEKEVVAYLESSFTATYYTAKWSRYQRNHILPIIMEASKISLKRETMLTEDALFYLVHCMAMTSFLTPAARAKIWVDLLADEGHKLWDQNLRGER